ncbi:membrane copper amine oxidase [Penicillium samsonianum]|uniref:membrane copper amine oxidase n=1 Tax=Penicillium samsonianum TaxID=1882272 RepID=UPI002547A7E4|nr:membrane copper amine oxidase [Penicillium samsonianum]KAJ6118214.1 membrane copper amine oxidase [Penicillium samsonianum]
MPSHFTPRLIVATMTGVLVISLTVFFFFSQAAPFFVPREINHTASSRPSDFDTSSNFVPRQNIWADLSDREVVDVLKHVHSVASDLNLTAAVNATLWDNFVHGIELSRPTKKDALRFITGVSEKPTPRYARIAVHHGTSSEVYWDEYIVGPLPVSEDTKINPVEYRHRTELEHARNLVPDAISFKHWPYSIAQSVADITQDLLGSTINADGKLDPDGLEMSFRDPWVKDGRILRWCSFQRAGSRAEAGTLLPQGLYVKLDTTGRDPNKWKVLRWYYNGHLYHSTEDFRAAWQSPGFDKLPPNHDGPWTTIEEFSSHVYEREKPAPIMIHAGGPRYQLDRHAQYVSWMGFTFYWSFAQATGITLFDVRFQGDRILYELGLQEAMAQYAGSDPLQGAVAYLDSFFGMGRAMFELVPGYDCPAYADFMDTIIYDAERTQRRQKTICLFEYTADYPLQRHSTSFYVSISRNNYLVLRTTAVVGNYDYTVDYVFYLDGSIEIKVRASGYIQGAYLVPGETQEYGFRVHDQFSTSMHDHVINFKADFDIIGSQNTLIKVDIEPKTKSYPWSEGEGLHTMGLSSIPISKECGFNWPSNSQSMYIVTNNHSQNKWGETRGYRIMPGSGMGTPAHLAFEGSRSLGRAAMWATKDLWVTKQKDDEVRSASPRNAFNTDQPMVDFSQYLDDEEIEQEDLVIWFNLGNHHVPHSGDIPNTLQHTSSSSVMLVPFNFHDRDASRKSAQGVRVDLAGQNGGTAKAQFFGHHYEHGFVLDENHVIPNLTAYGAQEHHVRKFPYTEDMLSM